MSLQLPQMAPGRRRASARRAGLGATLGLGLDGDADRLVVADEQGTLVDGDQIMALVARSWHERGLLRGGGVRAGE